MKTRITIAVLDEDENHVGNATYIDIPCSSLEQARSHLDNFETIVLEQLNGDVEVSYEHFVT